jgi:hypothetical protein
MPSTSLFQWSLRQSLGKHFLYNVVNFQQDPGDVTTPVGGHLDALNVAVSGIWTAQMIAEQSVSLVCVESTVAALNAAVPDPRHPGFVKPSRGYLTSPSAIALAGTVAGDYLPSFNACTIRTKTFAGTRNYTGRLHVGGLPESSTTGQEMVGARLTAITSAALKVMGVTVAYTITFSGVTCHFYGVVFSRTLFSRRPVGTQPLEYASAITSASGNLRIGSMVGRKLQRAAP